MSSPFPFQVPLVFGFLSVMLLVGVVCRAWVPLIQRFLIPACLIGGLLGLALVSTGLTPLPVSDLEAFAFHLFNISFISVGLTPSSGGQRVHQRGALIRGPLWLALMEGVTLPLQAVIGGGAVIVFGWFGVELFSTFGFFAPLGFTEGPGQALSIGKVWEGFGFANAATIGLTFAAVGFFFAFLVGVPLCSWGIRRGLAVAGAGQLDATVLKGIVDRHRPKEPAGALTMHSGNIDTLAFHLAMVGLVYVITYGVVWGLGRVLPADAANILWGFFFFFGLGVGLLVRTLMGWLGIAHLLDAGTQRRVTGWSVDFLIVATVAAIQVPVVWRYIVPISVICLLCGVLTTAVVVFLGRRLDEFALERTVAIFGTVTGTVSTGLLLLRIVDPEFETPVAIEIGVMNVIVLPIIVGTMVLVNAPVWWHWSVGLTTLVLGAVGLVCLGAIRWFKLWGARRF